jgi:hypothetical protein
VSARRDPSALRFARFGAAAVRRTAESCGDAHAEAGQANLRRSAAPVSAAVLLSPAVRVTVTVARSVASAVAG